VAAGKAIAHFIAGAFILSDIFRRNYSNFRLFVFGARRVARLFIARKFAVTLATAMPYSENSKEFLIKFFLH
jgi:hypothetical protein